MFRLLKRGVALALIWSLSITEVCAESFFNPSKTQYSGNVVMSVKDYPTEVWGKSFTIDATSQNPATVKFDYKIVLTGGCYDWVGVEVKAQKAGSFPMKHQAASASGLGSLTIGGNDSIYVEITMYALENPKGTTLHPYYPGSARVDYTINVVYGDNSQDTARARVFFDANGGKGSMPLCLYDLNTQQELPPCKFTREGYWFVGWSSSPTGQNTMSAREFVQEDGTVVRKTIGIRYSKAGDYTYYAVWKKVGYIVHYAKPVGYGNVADQYCEPNRVAQLVKCPFTYGNRNFVGWACSNGRRYDDGMLVFDLAKPGETVTMTAVWE